MFWRVAVMYKDRIHQTYTAYYNWRNILMSWQALYKNQHRFKRLCTEKGINRNLPPTFSYFTLHTMFTLGEDTYCWWKKSVQTLNGDPEAQRSGISE